MRDPEMFPIQKILCPTDFSESSERAIEAARELASYFQAELILLNVISDFPIPSESIPIDFDVDGYRKRLIMSSETSLEEIRSRIEETAIKVRSVALEGNPSDRIAKEALEEDVDLIVIPSRSSRGKGHLFGSVTERALRFIPCPILIIPAYIEIGPEDIINIPVRTINLNELFENHLEQTTEKLDAIEKKIEERKDGMNHIFRERVAELEERTADAQKKMDRIVASSYEAWDEIKIGFVDLWAGFDRAISKFRPKKNNT